MCGRYTLRNPRGHRWLRDEIESAPARHNIAPSQRILVVGRDSNHEMVVGQATWGFHPRWLADDRKSPINARAETARDKPMFRSAFRKGRCLVPADGWYEWQKQAEGPRQPFFFHRPDDAVFWFAGLAATDARGERTMAILTTDANALAHEVHSRMPAVLPNDETALAWIDPAAEESALQELLEPVPNEVIEAYPVSRRVNKPENDDAKCVERIQD